MRPLKFRAWNGENMEYGGFVIHAGGKIINNAPELCRVKEDSPVMQFTGLTDKNGKEIYEGDILKICRHWDSSMMRPQTVEFVDGKFYPFGTGDWEPDMDEVEVVGNIHETPELLEARK